MNLFVVCLSKVVFVAIMNSLHFIMTQNRLKLLTLISFSLLAFALFELPTIFCLALTLFCTYRYLKTIIQKHIERGLIELFPEHFQHQLLNKSIFDFICNFWFFESFRLLKLLLRPLIDPVDPDNPIEALQDINPQTKHKYLVKGVIRIMPESCQQILLGRGRMKQIAVLRQEEELLLKKGFEEENTDVPSQIQIPKMQRASSQSRLKCLPKMQQQSDYSDHERKIQTRVRVNHISMNRKRSSKQPPKKNILQILQNSVNMVKRILQIQNVHGHIMNMNTATVLKLMVVFWLVLLAQIKFNKNTRQIVIKILYVLAGIISVFGTVATTGVLIYKHCKKHNESHISEIQQ